MDKSIRGEGAGVLYSEPLSPAGSIFVRKESELSIDCFVQFQNVIDIFSLKQALKSLLRTCPRLRSVVIKDNGGLQWKEIPDFKIDDLIIIPTEKEDEEEKVNTQIYINKYLTSLPSMSALRRNLPLWEVHILPKHHHSIVIRLHHALGDCVSLLALLLSCCDNPVEARERKKREKPIFAAPLVKVATSLWRVLKGIGYTIPYAIELSSFSTRGKQNGRLVVQGDLNSSPRKLACVQLSLDDMKALKNKLNATINDVFVGLVLNGISKYQRSNLSNDALKDGIIAGVVAVNIRGQGSQDILRSICQGKNVAWGNKIGFYTLPIKMRSTNDVLHYVRNSKCILDKKKISYEAHYSYNINYLVTSLFGIEALSSIDYQFRHNTSILFSNIIGPSNPTSLAGNQVIDIGVTLSTLSAAMDVHMISYNGKAYIQFLVAEEIIKDPEILCIHVKEALAEMVATVLKGDTTVG